MKTFNATSLKDKFGDFLSLCVLEGISLEALNNRIVFDPYFDFMERNDVGAFVNEDNSILFYRLFGSRISERNISSFDNAVKWCGYAYISISVSLSIPLRKVLLLYPLNYAVADFTPYHEMAPIRVLEKFKSDFAVISPIKRLLEYGERIPYGAPLATLIHCDVRTLNKLVDDPLYHLKAPAAIIADLCRYEGWDEVFFRRSTFIPYYPKLWDDAAFTDDMIRVVKLMLRKHADTAILFDDSSGGFDIPVNYSGLVLSEYEANEYVNGKFRRSLPPSLFELALSFSIDAYKERCNRQGIPYC